MSQGDRGTVLLSPNYLLYAWWSVTYFVHGSDSSKLIHRLINKISLCAVPRLKSGAAFAPAKFISLGFAKNCRLGVHKTCYRPPSTSMHKGDNRTVPLSPL